MARQFFDAWLVQLGDCYDEKEIEAMWVGFAHRICDLYHEDHEDNTEGDLFSTGLAAYFIH